MAEEFNIFNVLVRARFLLAAVTSSVVVARRDAIKAINPFLRALLPWPPSWPAWLLGILGPRPKCLSRACPHFPFVHSSRFLPFCRESFQPTPVLPRIRIQRLSRLPPF